MLSCDVRMSEVSNCNQWVRYFTCTEHFDNERPAELKGNFLYCPSSHRSIGVYGVKNSVPMVTVYNNVADTLCILMLNVVFWNKILLKYILKCFLSIKESQLCIICYLGPHVKVKAEQTIRRWDLQKKTEAVFCCVILDTVVLRAGASIELWQIF